MTFMSRRLGLAAFVLVLAAGFTWGQMATIQLATTPAGVKYLTDAKGMTLYYYTLDTNGQSACAGPCVERWPIYYAESVSAPSPLTAGDFATITRADGIKQTTYKGWPLYYWYQDKNPGELKGEGVGKVWFIMESPHYSVMIGTNKAIGGNYLVDGGGNSLYYFAKDSEGKSACSGDCLKNWPAFAPSSLVVPSGLSPADFATITRDDGARQLAFKGYPLYYFARDKSRGDVVGQGVGNNWYLIDPAKFPAKS
jgi:predicted lipoprotein with Yx(FWY)xxD motif